MTRLLALGRETSEKVWHWLDGNFPTSQGSSEAAAAAELEPVLLALKCDDSRPSAASLTDEAAVDLGDNGHNHPPAGKLCL